MTRALCRHAHLGPTAYRPVRRRATLRPIAGYRFRASPVSMTMTVLDGRFLAANASFRSMLGYTADELLACSLTDATSKEDQELDAEMRAELLRLPRSTRVTFATNSRLLEINWKRRSPLMVSWCGVVAWSIVDVSPYEGKASWHFGNAA